MRPFNLLCGGPSLDSRRRSTHTQLQVVSSPEAARVAGDGVLIPVVGRKDMIAFSVSILGFFL
jgi:hypothetical protein